ncbi:AAA ATPase domain-containing protein [Roseovarius azorensis]|uniref:AAA ATPase domain-containing protein n=1 Tax=Roseovarius azorensis TaxID=1287727 RepID=A0A1H7KIH5_9RHOB|nr:ATP-binding protein [Roseovarius azorensis]SEK85795.1 AAA ATPase domain-containing protein [Roseovarius azorensis]
MDPRLNPFVPSAGVRPPEFAGREDLVEQASIAFDRIKAGLHANSMFLLGLRGVGKTVLLNALHEKAKATGFETIKLEVPDDSGGHLAQRLVPGLSVVLRRLDRMANMEQKLGLAAAALRNFAAIFRVEYDGISMGATPATPDAGSGDLEADLPELLRLVADAAAARGSAIGIFIDEIQYLSRPELSALARALHEAAQSGFRLIVIGAGLPQIAALVGEAKSYAERLLLFPEVGPLDDKAARRALREPVERAGVRIDTGALDLIIRETQGYAYFLQTWGKFAWDEAGHDGITEDDLRNASPAILNHLDMNFFRVRFDRCSELEQQYLRAMAELGSGPHRTGDIANALGTNSSQVAATRSKLIKAGMIYSQRHGETAFTVPLFDRFMLRALPELMRYSARKGSRK